MIVLAAVLVGCAIAAVMTPAPDARLRHVIRHRSTGARDAALPAWVPWAAVALLGIGALVGLGPIVGGAIAVLAAVVLPRFLGRLQSARQRERSRLLTRQSEVVADVLAATLASGAPVPVAMECVQAACPEPMRSALAPVTTALRLGADPTSAWLMVGSVEGLAPIADAVVRSTRTGAPLARLLSRLADDLRRDHHRAVEVAARSAGVRAVAPLALCFLPAFLLLGVVPVVASLAGSLTG